jgi:hypothetical protein
MHENIARIIEDDRAKARAYLAKFPNEQRSAATPDAKISAAREFVRESKVGSSALRVWRATLHYYAWCKREDWPKWNEIGVSDVVDRHNPSPDATGFSWRDHAWLFKVENDGASYSGDKDIGKLHVLFDGNLVLELAVAKGYGEFDDWYETDVNALSIGPWAGALVEMSAELGLAEQRHRARTERDRLEAHAARIQLAR